MLLQDSPTTTLQGRCTVARDTTIEALPLRITFETPIQMEKFLLALCKSRWTHHYPAHSGTKCSTLDRLQQMNVASIRLEHQKVKRAASLAFLSGCCTGLAKQGLCRAYKTKVRWSLKSKKFRALKFRYKLSSSLPH